MVAKRSPAGEVSSRKELSVAGNARANKFRINKGVPCHVIDGGIEAAMDFALSEEQRAFQETARSFARAEMMPFAREWDENETFPAHALRRAAALGFGGLYVREDVGGAALSNLDAVIIYEELAKGCTSTTAYLSIHNMAAWMIDRFASDTQRQRLLPPLCRMQHFASYCLTEPGAGSDAASIATRAVRE